MGSCSEYTAHSTTTSMSTFSLFSHFFQNNIDIDLGFIEQVHGTLSYTTLMHLFSHFLHFLQFSFKVTWWLAYPLTDTYYHLQWASISPIRRIFIIQLVVTDIKLEAAYRLVHRDQTHYLSQSVNCLTQLSSQDGTELHLSKLIPTFVTVRSGFVPNLPQPGALPPAPAHGGFAPRAPNQGAKPLHPLEPSHSPENSKPKVAQFPRKRQKFQTKSCTITSRTGQVF